MKTTTRIWLMLDFVHAVEESLRRRDFTQILAICDEIAMVEPFDELSQKFVDWFEHVEHFARNRDVINIWEAAYKFTDHLEMVLSWAKYAPIEEPYTVRCL